MPGRRVAESLIEAVAAIRRERGLSVVHWILADNEDRSRGVYHQLATRTMRITDSNSL